MNTYTPDSWVIVRMHHGDDIIDKVFAGWYGGFATGDSWKLSSGIVSTEEFEDRYEFSNYSGSVYVCYKQYERMSNYMATIYSSFEKQYAEYSSLHPDVVVSIEIIKYSKD